MSDRPGGLGGFDIWVSELGRRRLVVSPSQPGGSDQFSVRRPLPLLRRAGLGRSPTGRRPVPEDIGGNDIWTSPSAWTVSGTKPENLGPNVNTAATEHHSLPSPDGRSLYVTAVRADGPRRRGHLRYDPRRDDGVWGPLVNLGPAVNTPEHDRCPAFSPDLGTFYFDSERAGRSRATRTFGPPPMRWWWEGTEPRGLVLYCLVAVNVPIGKIWPCTSATSSPDHTPSSLTEPE